ncbi:hypothetical protein DWX23_12270 [Parabacteroides sp. AF18-52]|jgi:hypothetical protein|uniref:DUF6722 family protein n=1 Tax=Parabacteroides TaxID=375288 RepID=UPI000EFEC8C9|nr:DUF6722 family protein [Parabacteroides sp. AF18-52]RHR39030.1 hypothetical protein DWX23_12270 [Parabacteroides sp. AF18-52]
MKNKQKTRIVAVPVIQKQIRKEEISISKELGRYLWDVSKLVIGGAVITTVLQLNTDKYLVIAAAVSLAIFLFVCGLIILIFKKK